MTKPVDIQDKEEACIKRICRYFNWTCGVAPNPLCSNYEDIKLNLREYIPLSPTYRESIKFYSSTKGEGTALWLIFEDFLELLDVVEWFSNNNWLHELDLANHNIYSVSNPFYNKHLKSIEEIEIFLDLLEAKQQ